MKKMIIYPNASKGGVAAVIRGRAVDEPKTEFHCVFFTDKGGRDAFKDLPNVHVRIVQKGRVPHYISYLARTHSYAQISILSAPDIVAGITIPEGPLVAYEFHSSNIGVIEREINTVDFSKIHQIVVPSKYLADRISEVIPTKFPLRPDVVPNLVDSTSFFRGSATQELLEPGSIPLFWVGRFDKGKGYTSFLRTLSLLPKEYRGIVIVSLESDPARAADFLGEAGAAGVFGRVDLLLNLPQAKIGEMFRQAVGYGGALISTSLMESFGYSVAEAVACGLNVRAFELPPFAEHDDPDSLLKQVPIGDVPALAASILERRDTVQV